MRDPCFTTHRLSERRTGRGRRSPWLRPLGGLGLVAAASLFLCGPAFSGGGLRAIKLLREAAEARQVLKAADEIGEGAAAASRAASAAKAGARTAGEFGDKGLPRLEGWVRDATGADLPDPNYVPLEIDQNGKIVMGYAGQILSVSNQTLLDMAGGKKILVREDDAFKHAARIESQIGGRPMVVYDETTGALRRGQYDHVGGRLRLRLESRSGLWVEADDRSDYDATERALAIATAAHRLDLVSFFDPLDVSVRHGLTQAAGASHHAFGGQQTEAVLAEIRRGANRIVVLVSHVEDGMAVVRDPQGRMVGSLPLAELQAAAAQSDNTLIFLGCRTSQSPVGGFVLPVRTDPIVVAISRAWNAGDFTLGNFLGEMGETSGGFVVSRAQGTALRQALTIRSLSPQATTGLLLAGAMIDAPTPDRQDELSRRLVPHVPSYLQYTELLAGLLLLLGPVAAWKSWASVGWTAFPKQRGRVLYGILSISLFVIVGAIIAAPFRLVGKFYHWVFVLLPIFLGIGSVVSVVFGVLSLLAVASALVSYAYLSAAKTDPDGAKPKLIAVLLEGGAFGVLCLAFQVLFLLPLLLFLPDPRLTMNWLVGAAFASWALSLIPGAIIIRRTGDLPTIIFQRLWADPYWPFRQFLAGGRMATS
ncbi:MAG: hypothetical protein JWM33_2201 [Caulobacteraceae bacterium]|nr:hypothetical protein [Caulobacteraceae bacterium]